ncbi:hypothetical protein MWN52_10425 [Pseudoxanthomonas winnipegensis]|uniref:hypothetical protein n=1 Tax=Pseudoxanthomonas winnipegensis TaxID=2480810 RepID=UPI002575F201|nr:hypothetical protein [Pseudoxanthomonas winnipegensis]WJI14073.1 hypothetical protein MWN52_10425 [Pseudoxanthomonas winnipegensis]
MSALVACLAGAATAWVAQAGSDPTASILSTFQASATSRSPLPALEQLRSIETSANPGAQRFKRELEATLLAQSGMYEDALVQIPYPVFNALGTGPYDALPDARYRAVDAATAIAKLAKGRRVVIINEAHHVPQTRALVAELLPLLRAAGFTDYAAEAPAGDTIGDIERRGYAVQRDGIYTREPVFGQLLRSAAGLGYRLDAHEYVGEQQDQQARETGQAQNLARLLKDRPDARVLVHVGYSHVREARHADYLPMAAELKRLTGIDPLTIDQVEFQHAQPHTRERSGYRALLERLPAAQMTAAVFVDDQGKPWSLEPRQYDVSVVLPDPPARNGRPGWLWQPVLERHPVALDPTLCAGHFPCAVAARHRTDTDDAVPADMVLLRGAQTVTSLALPAGQFALVAIDEDDQVLGRVDFLQVGH